MTPEVACGFLGPAAVAKLRTIAAVRERLDRDETETLALVAEAQGFTSETPVRFRYDLEARTWTALPADDRPTDGGETAGGRYRSTSRVNGDPP